MNKITFFLPPLIFSAHPCTNNSAPTSTDPFSLASDKPSDQSESKRTGHILLMSDIHLCHLDWNGHTSERRVNKMIEDLNAYAQDHPYSDILFLGDYSLDFWQHGIKGSYRNQQVSNTENMIKNYFSKLSCQSYYMIPGNHEQYSNEKWLELTGRDRQFSVIINGWLFIMLDNFSENLNPSFDSDGAYSNADVAFIKAEMEKHPDLPTVLCAHFFDEAKETAEFRQLVKSEDRIICLFAGHDHANTDEKLSQRSWGGKYLFHAGNYSYTRSPLTVRDCAWGWRELTFDSTGITVSYYSPESSMTAEDGSPYTAPAGKISEIFIPLPERK